MAYTPNTSYYYAIPANFKGKAIAGKNIAGHQVLDRILRRAINKMYTVEMLGSMEKMIELRDRYNAATKIKRTK